MSKLMKMRIMLETVALVTDKDVFRCELDGRWLAPKPDFTCRVLRETIDNIPREDIAGDMTEIKSKEDLPYRWQMGSIPFMGKDDRSIKQILEEVSNEKQNTDSQRN